MLEENPMAAFGALFATQIADAMIDSFVTPEGVIQMLANEKNADSAEGAEEKKPGNGSAQKEEHHMAYQSFDKFYVSLDEDWENGDRLYLTRKGLFAWKVSSIRMDVSKLSGGQKNNWSEIPLFCLTDIGSHTQLVDI